MSMDVFQDKIRKTKNPAVLLLEAIEGQVPREILAAEPDFSAAMARYCRELLEGLKGLVPAVRFGFGSFALGGCLGVLEDAMALAGKLGYYVLLDLPELLTPAAAQNAARLLQTGPAQGFVVQSYLGSDILAPLAGLCAQGKTLFCVARTANRSAVEVQDLLTGGRLVHTAAVDVINRQVPDAGKHGYSPVGVLAAASAPESLKTLRAKFPRLFLLLDGYDYPNANAKNCAAAFDRLGHGAAACAALGCAWQEAEGPWLASSRQAAERMRRNITRYITVL